MTKADIVELIHERLGLTKKDIAKVVDELFTEVRTKILEKTNVKISGFGNFEVKKEVAESVVTPRRVSKLLSNPELLLFFAPARYLKTR